MRVCIGGTFSPLHKGHKILIKKAFEVAGEEGSVFIGVVTGKMLKGKGDVKPFEGREKIIEQFLSEEGLTEDATIEPIYDKYGPSIQEDFDAIVVSPETIKNAEEINNKRKKLNKKPLKIIQIPFILAEDKLPISSSRIKRKEINEDGMVLQNNSQQ